MQRGRGGRDPFFDFGNPFGNFGSFGGFGGQRSLMSNFFGGRDPFDDPFFTRPFGGMFESSFFGPGINPFPDMHSNAYLEHQPPEPKKLRGPIIEELNSDNEKEEAAKEPKKSKGPIIEELDSDDEDAEADKARIGNPRKHGRPSEQPYAQDPNDGAEFAEKKSKYLQHKNDYNRFNSMETQPQTHNFTYQSSSVSYGGVNGTYYTSSKTRRTGSDGVTIEESKEADSAARQASHRVSRGLHNKGHTVARKLNSDGRVDTMQTLHNLHEEELPGFEEAWKGNARQHLPGWTGSFGRLNGSASSGQNEQVNRGGWALPYIDRVQHTERVLPDPIGRAGSSRLQHARGSRGSSDVRDKSAYTQWTARE